MNANQSAGKNLSKFDIGFIAVGVISLILMLLDRQNHTIYGEIVLFAAFLFFFAKGIYYTKINNLKYATMCFLFVTIATAAEIVKFLMRSNVF
ncbi:hypothetical protein JNUCC1_02815 [Lentibacillus sp. JNUCC-1]|uniref:hypothetical protein n=1 Tax=Lentibacillus sp. JNUCC-1 TaxID=2654513 RepID=UPI0012E855A2|nr:hypothetical protein [Lentibacillus sp. JNUCC-1]MUV38943.1 hypothetical protein [Lentibacillus sp. JNUCC-1]